MSAVADAAVQLEDALETVPDVRVHRDPGVAVDPPAVILGPPNLFWHVLDPDPIRAVFDVWVIVPADDRALERLWELVPAVSAAVPAYDRAAVGSAGATPRTWSSAGVDLPAYVLSVEVML